MHTSFRKKQSGFTLIEILISGVILFSVISIVSSIYRGAVLSSSKASKSIELSAAVPLLLDTIRFHIRESKETSTLSQDGVIDGIVFEWQASVIKEGAPPKRFSPEDGSIINFTTRFYLWKVELQLEKDERQAYYEFEELTW